MALTNTERARIRRALGYVNVTHGSVLSFGIPLPNQFLFLVEARMGEVMEPDGEELVRENLGRFERTLQQVFEAQERLAAKRIGEIETNPDEMRSLYEQLRFWSRQLAEVLGVPPHVISFVGGSGGRGINVPVG